jgi:hypothetical protein
MYMARFILMSAARRAGVTTPEVDVETAVNPPHTLHQDGLSRDQQLHFAEHGWILLDQAVDPELSRACREASERLIGRLTCGRTRDPSDRGNTMAYREAQLLEPVFYELFKTPGLLAAARQLIGHDKIRHLQAITTIIDPDHERNTQPEVVKDRRNWGWHRCFCPKNIITPHDTDAQLIHSSMLNVATYFVPISPEHGVTALLDKSHTYEGRWKTDQGAYHELGDRLEVVQPTAGAGSVILFSEAVMHAAAPVLSEQRRFAHFAWLGVPWFNRWGQEPYLQPYFADEGVRDLFAPCESDDPDS